MMEFRFEVYDPDEIVLISNFLLEIAKTRRKQQKLNQLGLEAAPDFNVNNTYAPPPGLQPPGSGSVLGGIPKWPKDEP